MSKNAVVLAVRGGEAILLEQGGAFRRVPDRRYTVGQVLGNILPASSARIRGGLLRRVLLIACALALLCSSAFAAGKYMTWTQVTLESGDLAVLYRLNYLDEVIETVPLSQQAETLLSETSSDSGTTIESVLDKAISESEETSPEIQVSVSSVFRAKSSRTVQAAADISARKGRTVRIEERPWGDPPVRPSRNDSQPSGSVEPERLPAVDQEPSPEDSLSQAPESSSSSKEPALISQEQPSEEPAEPVQEAPAAAPLQPDQGQPDTKIAEPPQDAPAAAPVEIDQGLSAPKTAGPAQDAPAAAPPQFSSPFSEGQPAQAFPEQMPQGAVPSEPFPQDKSFQEKH